MAKFKPVKTYYQLVTVDSIPLPKLSCDYVMLSAEPIKVDGSRIAPDANGTYFTTGKEVVWGIGAEAMHTLYIGQTTNLIPVENLDQISVKAINPDAGQIVVWSCFKEIKEDDELV